MLLPVRDEKRAAFRPTTVAIILLLCTTAGFLLGILTERGYDTQNDVANLRAHILVLKARYPELTVSPVVQQIIGEYRWANPEGWAHLAMADRQPADDWEATVVYATDPNPVDLQAAMDDLDQRFGAQHTSDSNLLWKFGYHSYRPTPESYLGHQFLQAGWFQFLIVLWVLWFCGIVFEELWEPFVVLGAYLAAGCFSAFAHGLLHPHSAIPVVGAFGSLAGLLGVLLIAYPKRSVRMAYVGLTHDRSADTAFVRLKKGEFVAPVFVVAAILLVAEEIFALSASSAVSRWEPLAGLIFGTAIGGGIYLRRRQRELHQPKEPEQVPATDQALVDAAKMLDRFDAVNCIAEVRAYLQKEPDSIEAWQLLLRAQNDARDYAGARDETLPNLVRLSFAARETTQALRYIERYRNLGGAMLPPDMWLELCQKYEQEHFWEAAAQEYEQLGKYYYVFDRVAVTALLCAARIYLHELRRPAEAGRLYRAAQSSPVPHLEVNGIIEEGLRQCDQLSKLRSTSQ